MDIDKDRQELTQIILDLKDSIREYGLVSLSALLIGHNKRVFVINFNNRLTTFINPYIESRAFPKWVVYKSPSMPDKRYSVLMFDEIDVFYTTPLKEIKKVRLKKESAYAFQLEYMTLDGILLSDIGIEYDEEFDKLTEEEKKVVYQIFLDKIEQLNIDKEEIEKEIDSLIEDKREENE